MPFTIDPDFAEALSSTIDIAMALRIVRSDGQVFAFTDADEDILLPAHTWGGITIPQTLYRNGEGKFPRDIQQSRDPRQVDTWEFIAYYNDDHVSELDVRKHLFRGARHSLIFFARENLSWQLLRQRGELGTGTLGETGVTWKMAGLSRAFQDEVIELTSPLSRADRWDHPALAFFDLTGETADGFTARVIGPASLVNPTYSRRQFTLAATVGFPDNRFTNGTILFLFGANAGYEGEVLYFDNATGAFTLKDAAPYDIANGDSLRVQMAPPRTYEQWMACFGDARYFAGEIAISTLEKAAEVS